MICVLRPSDHVNRALSRIIPKYFASRPNSTGETLRSSEEERECFLEKTTCYLLGLTLILYLLKKFSRREMSTCK